MKGCLLAILYYLGFQIVGGVQIQASSTDQRVFDEAQLFDQEESDLLSDTIENLQQIMNIDVIVATIEDALGYSTFDYADMFYEEHNFGVGVNNSGVLLLIDMDNRGFDVLTEGVMIDYLTDDRIDAILDDVFNEVVDGNYYEAADQYLTLVSTFYEEGLVVETQDPLTLSELISMLILSAAVGVVFYKSVVRKYEKVLNKPSFSVNQNSQLNLKRERDIFLHRRVSKTNLPKNPPSSNSGTKGGSGSQNMARGTTRTASSGRSRGGGGRSF